MGDHRRQSKAISTANLDRFRPENGNMFEPANTSNSPQRFQSERAQSEVYIPWTGEMVKSEPPEALPPSFYYSPVKPRARSMSQGVSNHPPITSQNKKHRYRQQRSPSSSALPEPYLIGTTLGPTKNDTQYLEAFPEHSSQDTSSGSSQPIPVISTNNHHPLAEYSSQSSGSGLSPSVSFSDVRHSDAPPALKPAQSSAHSPTLSLTPRKLGHGGAIQNSQESSQGTISTQSTSDSQGPASKKRKTLQAEATFSACPPPPPLADIDLGDAEHQSYTESRASSQSQETSSKPDQHQKKKSRSSLSLSRGLVQGEADFSRSTSSSGLWSPGSNGSGIKYQQSSQRGLFNTSSMASIKGSEGGDEEFGNFD